MGGLFCRALAKTRPNWRLPWIVFLSILLTTLYGVSDEIHQSFVASRMAEGADILADFAGGAVGALCLPIGCLLVRRKGGGV
jgi:VanZ family protein